MKTFINFSLYVIMIEMLADSRMYNSKILYFIFLPSVYVSPLSDIVYETTSFSHLVHRLCGLLRPL